MTPILGSTLAHYRILAPLGSGAMGEVYRARDTRLDREVAIKVLPEHFASDDERVRRFEREAKSLASLNHPNIAQIYGVDQHERTYFLALELVPGETLEERLKRGALPLDEALDIAKQIAEGLEAAHEAGVIHRDLKPANVRITPDGKVKVLDFGLAKPAKLASEAGSSTDSVLSTEQGRLLGTPTYMAPEQARGKPIDKRVDVWAFGCVLFECLTGERAFSGDTLTDVLAAVVDHEPDWSRLPSDTPPRVARLVARCLEKPSHERLRDVGEARVELERIRSGKIDDVGHPRRRARGRDALARALPWLVAVLGAVFGALGWISRTRASSAQPRTLDLSLAAPGGGRLVVDANAGWGVVSPDGTRVALMGSSEEGFGLWMRSLSTDDAQLIPGTDDASYPFWSPDSRWLAFFDGNRLKKLELAGGLPEVICEVVQGRGGSWGEDGWILLTPSGGGSVHRVRCEGGVPEPVTRLDAQRGDSAHYWPQALGEGRFLYFIRSAREDRQGIYIAEIDAAGKASGERRVIASTSSGLYVSGERGADGHLVWALEDGEVLARPMDPRTGELTGPARSIGVAAGVLESQRAMLLSASREGTFVVAAPVALGHQIAEYARDGAGPKVIPLSLPNVGLYELTLSPDGKLLAFVVAARGDGDLWVVDPATDTSRPLTSGPGYEEGIAWSPDGEEIAFSRGMPNAMELWRVRARRGGELKLGDPEVELDPIAWLRDDRLVMYRRGGKSACVWMEIGSNAAPEIILEDVESCEVSSDGRRIVWIARGASGAEAFVAKLESESAGLKVGSPQRIVLPHVRKLQWSQGGNELIALASDGFLHAVAIDEIDGVLRPATPVRLFRAPSDHADYTVSPDGEVIYFRIEPNASNQTLRVLTNWTERLEARGESR